ncbi:hypothetical protein OG921_04460 [Aldersonia sp. NBC_00410]|uniref:hypothetical protein n=1 Tax=Aldersonia sp. NBC_00410 TaxID=2975954 RepID=UPI00224CEBDD|nr:hypothetical protein [Aldersonia sp. NBC_00410]MCX5042431.1 hypothetical protein [Aldersonia sp. NBC_00410]
MADEQVQQPFDWLKPGVECVVFEEDGGALPGVVTGGMVRLRCVEFVNDDRVAVLDNGYELFRDRRTDDGCYKLGTKFFRFLDSRLLYHVEHPKVVETVRANEFALEVEEVLRKIEDFGETLAPSEARRLSAALQAYAKRVQAIPPETRRARPQIAYAIETRPAHRCEECGTVSVGKVYRHEGTTRDWVLLPRPRDRH